MQPRPSHPSPHTHPKYQLVEKTHLQRSGTATLRASVDRRSNIANRVAGSDRVKFFNTDNR